MSNLVRSTRCRPSGNRSHRWITLMMIVAMFAFAGHVFADAGQPVKPVVPGSSIVQKLAVDDAANPSDDNPPGAANVAVVAPPPNDTCAGATPLPLNRTVIATSVDATNDYQSPSDTTCFSQLGHTPTTSPGRDIVFSFTAPDAGKYSVRIIQQGPNSDSTRQRNATLYASSTCPGSGVVSCLPGGGANGGQSGAFVSNTGTSSNQSEEISCLPLAAGETIYVFFDNAQPGNAGGLTSLEAIQCTQEVEPNNTSATANPFFCGISGTNNAIPVFHCYLGSKAGQPCTRTTPLDPSFRNCSLFPDKRCTTDLDCLAGEGTCVLPVDYDCDPRCDVGSNAGLPCTTTGFCNPGSDQGAVCAGTCQAESTCVDNATGANTGTACTPICVGGLFPGRYCSSLTGCPGGGVCTVNAGCAAGQACSRQYNEGDADYFSLGTPPSGSKVFAVVDAKSAGDQDWRMRITSATKTFQFDDDDNIGRMGANAPNIAGAVTDGSPAYIKVSKSSPRPSSPYRVNAIVRGALATAQLEDESGPLGNDGRYYWPADVVNANPTTTGGYVRGNFNYLQDTDCFKFLANEGDLIQWWGDGNPGRLAGGVSLTNVAQAIIYDTNHAAIENFGFGMAPGRRNTNANTAQPTDTALSPSVLSFYQEWRATYTGMLEICMFDASEFIGLGAITYPSPYAGSLAVNCGPVQNAGPGTTTADVSLTTTGPAGPVQAGQFVEYVISATNNGSQIAQEVVLSDTLDPNLSFVSLVIDDGFDGENTACSSLPTLGGNDAPIDCNTPSVVPGLTVTYTLTVQVNNCIGAGVEISNTASITTVSTDPTPSNDSATAGPFTTVDDGSCTDIACDSDAGTCVPDLCSSNDSCVGTECRTVPLVGFHCSGDLTERCAAINDPHCPDLGLGTCQIANGCNDSSVCTDDSCNPAVGCINDSSQAGDLCDDFNACTVNGCHPITFCDYPSEGQGTACDDGLGCYTNDQCDGQGNCGGTIVPECNDANGCTDDFADEANACACSHASSTGGTTCDDDNACTGTEAAGDACDGAGACTGGQAVSCDDGNVCTADSCDSGLGCVNTPVPNGTTCDDGNAGTSGDSCQGGSCVGEACTSTNSPKSKGWYKGLCHNSHSGDSLSNADAACVGASTTTFAGMSTVADICEVLLPSSPNNDSCGKAEDQLMTLALNICKQRVCPSNAIDSACGNNTTVGQSLAQSDAIFAADSRTTATCNVGECLDKEINNGHALELDSLLSMREGGNLRLNWLAPNVDDGQGQVNHYTISRRAIGSKTPFVQIGTTTGLTFVDVNVGTGSWEYDLVPNY